jgi:hypothetical protein
LKQEKTSKKGSFAVKKAAHVIVLSEKTSAKRLPLGWATIDSGQASRWKTVSLIKELLA